MRKIFLLICIAAFTSASAQENDLFDIGKYLQKKQAEKVKKNEQKTALLPFQKNNPVNNLTLLPDQSKAYTLSNGDRVITKPEYRMPVIVPDMKQFKIMPNPGEDYFAKNFYVPGQPKFKDIPNGAFELPLPNTLMELLKNKGK